MICTGYKLVKNEHGKKVSAFMYGKQIHTYCKGRWTKPRKGFGPLCVMADMMHYPFTLEGNEEVWECMFEKSHRRSVWTPQYKTPLSKLMRHTIPASRIKLVRKVDSGRNRRVRACV